MESKALALGKQAKAEALNSNVHQMEVTLFTINNISRIHPLTQFLHKRWHDFQ